MSDLLLHPLTKRAIGSFIQKPPHALLIVAPVGAGKAKVAHFIASRLLDTPETKLASHPYFRHIKALNGKTISIDGIREVIRFTLLKSTIATTDVKRLILIENSQYMTIQAQNALLKTIEEPPLGTILLLTAPSERALLPTIRSRVQQLVLQPPDEQSVLTYFHQQGYAEATIKKALLMSGGLPGLMHALLEVDQDHPLVLAATTARDILQKGPFERLGLIDELAKQRQTWFDTLFILMQMAHFALQQGQQNASSVQRWRKILAASYEAHSQTLANAQLKLVMLNFMLQL